MNRECWMLVRAYWPTVALFGLAFLMTVTLDSPGNSSLVTGVFSVLYWAPIILIGGAFLLLSAASYRLWRWERGEGPSCMTCAGPLGHEREGRANRGGAFRRCYACGKAVNHRYYD